MGTVGASGFLHGLLAALGIDAPGWRTYRSPHVDATC